MLHHSLTSLHFQIAKVFLDLYDVAKDVITAVIGEALLAEEIDVRVDGCNRFALLWRLVGEITTKRVFSGNLLLMLDSLSDQEPVVRLAGRTWLSASISKVRTALPSVVQWVVGAAATAVALVLFPMRVRSYATHAGGADPGSLVAGAGSRSHDS